MLLTVENPEPRLADTPAAAHASPAPHPPHGSLFVSAAGHRLAPWLAAYGIAPVHPATSGIQLHPHP